MRNSKKVLLPTSYSLLTKLKVGDFIKISGKIFAARDQTLKRIFASGRKFPKLKILYFCGPLERQGRIVSAGPTTTSRMEWAFEELIKMGTKFFIGKGGISPEAAKTIRGRAVYLEAPGGCGALLASKIKRSRIVAFPELQAQALVEMEVEDFPVVVAVVKEVACGNESENKKIEGHALGRKNFSPCL
ncbi:MAG: fumarate hydratase C-terminal domain-containing protein [Elusimicrobia bacterium]|nr:fumarate hydratase C-terminal domain-containing protein [Elusimicrobiota bacterium]